MDMCNSGFAPTLEAPRIVIARAPLRISFVGGGSDLPGGAGSTVSTAINQYVYVVAKWRQDRRFILHWKEREDVGKVSELRHDLAREVLLELGIHEDAENGGLELLTFADVPGVGSGLGSSAATTCALLRAVWGLQGISPNDEQVAEMACRIELERLARKGGRQDQYASALGGVLRIDYEDGRVAQWRQVGLSGASRRFLAEHFALFSPGDGAGRNADSVLSGFDNSEAFRKSCIALCDTFEAAICREDWALLGNLVGQHHALKISSFNGDTPYMSRSVHEGIAGVARFFKLCGAGSTGHLLVATEPRERFWLSDAMSAKWGRRLEWLPEPHGAEVIYAR